MFEQALIFLTCCEAHVPNYCFGFVLIVDPAPNIFLFSPVNLLIYFNHIKVSGEVGFTLVVSVL